ncbi:hypothetical protein C3747_14g86 [Trypanosoma cruzi]|uniref:Uncharacterized protein n=2 Tax=Trypanosoma cruzi TaxID=5693 RepID=Q4E691_TRYCC|nr:hypothetical protein, conserved [Trypanosoma cruzi]EAO00283.1 hypothetical protein, conserved [Trypanosoma cruzi]PWV18205.1 hypothetical protein C3747_14g86 [Trypanosoma cruzi]|eukprot:XP_822134.1 hypothetical protein [Trypanosoma cruzi strain CL Brener]
MSSKSGNGSRAPTTRASTSMPLYNTAVHSSLNPRPVMLRVPLLTPSRNEAEDENADVGESPLHAADPQCGPATAMDRSSCCTKAGRGADVCEGTGLNKGDARIFLMSPRSLWPLSAGVGVAEGRDQRRVTKSTPPVFCRRRSTLVLCSPRPSPPSKGGVGVERPDEKELLPATVITDAPKIRLRTGGDNDRVEIKDILPAAPPRRRVTSPLQHLLVYQNEAQRQMQGSSVGHICGVQGSSTPPYGVAASTPFLEAELQRPSPFVQGGDVHSASDKCRISPTSLQFSLPRDDKSDSSTDTSTFAAQMPFINTRRSPQRNWMSPLPNSRAVSSLAIGNEDCSTSEEDNGDSNKKATSQPVPCFGPVPSGMMTQVAGKARDNARSSRALRGSLAPSARPSDTVAKHRTRPAIPAKTDIMRAFHVLEIQKKTLVLMECEDKQRRKIINKYVHATRGILVNYTFRRFLILAQDETASSSLSRSRKVASSSSEAETRRRTSENVAKKEGMKVTTGLEVPGPLSYALMREGSGSSSSRSSRWRSAASGANINAREYSTPFSTGGSPNVQQYRRTGKELTAKGCVSSRSTCENKFFSCAAPTLPLEVGESMKNIHHAMRRFEGQILRLLSAEIRSRQRVVEAEGEAFHFLLIYHRLFETALQPSFIYLQEACHWQSIVTEATNAFHRLQCVRHDCELQQNIRSARVYARNVAAVVEEETRIRLMLIQQTESQEYHRLTQQFHLGLAALLELNMCSQRRFLQEVREEMETTAIQEMRGREALWTEELRQRGILYRCFEVEYGNHKLCHLDMPLSTHRRREELAVNASIELSSIMGGNDDNSCLSHVEASSATPLEVTIENVKTSSTVQSVKCGGAHLFAIATGEHDTARDAFCLRSGEQAAQVEREFFQWSSTSNTLPTTTNNTTTGSATVVVGGGSHSLHNTSIGENRKPQTASSPQPQTVYCPSATLHSGTSSLQINSVAGEKGDRGEKKSVDACVDVPVRVHGGDVDASIEVLDFPVDSSGLQKSVSSNSISKSLRRDVAVSVNMRSLDTSRSGMESHATPMNRHIVPCSLKCCGSRNGARYDASPSPLPRKGRGRQRMVSCGTQLTPPTRRPYSDDVIFDRAPHRISAKIRIEEVAPSKAMTGSMNESFNRAVSTNCSSFASSCQRKVGVQEKSRQGYVKEMGGGDETIERIESIDDTCHTAVGVDEHATHGGEEAFLVENNSTSSHSSKAVHPTEKAVELQERRKGTFSTGTARREGDTFPEYSLSTMLENTAAASVDLYETDGRMVKENPALTAVEITTVSSPSSCSHSVSATTGLNELSDGDANGDNCINDEEDCGGESYMSPIVVQANAFQETVRNTVDAYYPPLNYMRPTMSWRRQHEGLEWPTRLRPSQGRSRSVTSNYSLRSGNERNWKENTLVHLIRIPFEEGPGVWGDVEMPRRPFGYDALGNKAYEMTNAVCCRAPVTTTISSSARRRDAACRFMAEGSTSRSPSRARSSISCHANGTPTAEKENQEFFEDPTTLENLCGIVGRKFVVPQHRITATNAGRVSTTRRLRSMTPSYVDAFYKLDREVVGRKRFLASLRRGATLRESSRRAATTPCRQHSQHPYRRSDGGNISGRGLTLSPGTSCMNFSSSPWSPKPKPWR